MKLNLNNFWTTSRGFTLNYYIILCQVRTLSSKVLLQIEFNIFSGMLSDKILTDSISVGSSLTNFELWSSRPSKCIGEAQKTIFYHYPESETSDVWNKDGQLRLLCNLELHNKITAFFWLSWQKFHLYRLSFYFCSTGNGI